MKLHNFYSILKWKYFNLSSKHYIRKRSYNTKKTGVIKVGFLVQLPELWDKQESVYNEMISNNYFEPWLIIVPSYKFAKDKVGEYGSELDFFINKCKNDKYIVAKHNKSWRKLSEEGFDYIFYQRPYDHYLPRIYRSNQLVKFTKICYIPYATPEIRNTCIYPKYFFRNIYFGFMEDESSAKNNNALFNHQNHISFYNKGYPVFEQCLRLSKSCNYSSILWTPRWVIGKSSHFFDYNNEFSSYDWGSNHLIVRTHPLMWDNYIKNKLLTSTDVDKIKKVWHKKGIKIDTNSDILKTFNISDILISDKSSVIPMFFLTTKPIIFCNYGENDFSNLFSSLLPGLYITESWDELKNTIEMLLNGVDPLRDKRLEIIKSLFLQHSNATKSIIDVLLEDNICL